MPSVVDTLERNARRAPDREGLVFGERRLSHREFDGEVNRAAHALRLLGVAKGDDVGLMSPNTDQFVIAYYATLKLGASIVPITPRLAPPDLSYQLADSGAVALLFDPVVEATARTTRASGAAPARIWLLTREHDGAENLAALAAGESAESPGVPVAENDAPILYTSGATGKPKGVLLDHHRLVWVGVNISCCTGIVEGDRMVHVAPRYHTAELMFLMACTLMGCTHIVAPVFEPQAVLRALVEERSGIFRGVPTMFQFMLRQPNIADLDLPGLRTAMFGGAPMPPSVALELAQALPHARLFNLCGRTEAGPDRGARGGRADARCRPRRGRRIRPARRVDHEGLLEQARGDRRDLPRRLAPHRRSGDDRRGGGYRAGRPQEGSGHHRRHERLLRRGRAHRAVAPRRPRLRRDRRAPSALWWDGRRGRRAEARRRADPRRHPRRLALGAEPRNLSGKILKYQLREQLPESEASSQ